MNIPHQTNNRGGNSGLAIVLTVVGILLFVGVGYRMMLDVKEAKQYPSGGLSLTRSGYDLSTMSVDRAMVLPSNQRKDKLEALVDPGHIAAGDLAEINAKHRKKYVLSSDRVIGVVIDGQAVAYPVSVLNWHEVANDSIAGEPIAVTYNGLADCAAVYSRLVEGELLTFGVSGLVYDCNSLLYDRRDASGLPTTDPYRPHKEAGPSSTGNQISPDPGAPYESLWSQAGGMAVAGPLAGTRLRRIPSQLLRWEDWLAQYPESKIVKRVDAMAADYNKDVYGPYFQVSSMPFPVHHPVSYELQTNYSVTPKSRCILLDLPDGTTTGLLIDQVLAQASFDSSGLGTLQASIAGTSFVLKSRKRGAGQAPETVWLDPGQSHPPVAVASCFLFAAYALLPEHVLHDLETGRPVLDRPGGYAQD